MGNVVQMWEVVRSSSCVIAFSKSLNGLKLQAQKDRTQSPDVTDENTVPKS